MHYLAGLEPRGWTISEVCRRLRLTPRALRFYEARHLIAPLRIGRERLYTQNEIARIEQILALKAFGFSLTEIGAILRAPPVPGLEYPLTANQVSSQISFLRDQLSVTQSAIDELLRLETKIATTQAGAQRVSPSPMA